MKTFKLLLATIAIVLFFAACTADSIPTDQPTASAIDPLKITTGDMPMPPLKPK